MPYEFLDDIATADVAFHAWGETVEQMFAAAAEASMNVMVADLETIDCVRNEEFSLQSDEIDMLLFDLLQELIFLKDADKLLLRIKDLRISFEDGRYYLTGKACGEELDPVRHDLVVDVKAVTLHRFKVEQTPRGWEATVILDI